MTYCIPFHFQILYLHRSPTAFLSERMQSRDAFSGNPSFVGHIWFICWSNSEIFGFVKIFVQYFLRSLCSALHTNKKRWYLSADFSCARVVCIVLADKKEAHRIDWSCFNVRICSRRNVAKFTLH